MKSNLFKVSIAGILLISFINPVTAAANNKWDPLPSVEESRINGGEFSGAYRTGPAGAINWYFANIGLSAFVDRIPGEVKQYMNVYISNLSPSFTVSNIEFSDPYEPETSAWAKTRQDSDDAYAATFLSLAYRYYQATGDRAWLNANLKTLKNIAEYDLVRIQNANGLVRTYQNASWSDAYYTEDNCEDYKGLKDLSSLLASINDPDAARYNKAAAKIAKAIKDLMYLPSEKGWSAAWNGAVDPISYSATEIFYPGAVTQIFPEVNSVPLPVQMYAAGWNKLNSMAPGWENGQYDAHAWAILGYAAALHNDPTKAQAQQRRIRTMVADPLTRGSVGINDLGYYSETNKRLTGR